jgi:transcriptional regulator PpsR
LFLVRFVPVATAARAATPGANTTADLIEHLPDGFVVTDMDGDIISANRAFLDIAQIASERHAKGRSIGDWIGRPGADLSMMLAVLKKHDSVRLMATAVRGEHGGTTEVEVSAAMTSEASEPAVGFIIRDVTRRVASGPQGARDLTRAVEQLTGLVGRVSMPDLLRDTVELVERHYIEAALELTSDNRTAAAEVLGLSRQSLYVKLRRHRLLAAGDAEETA